MISLLSPLLCVRLIQGFSESSAFLTLMAAELYVMRQAEDASAQAEEEPIDSDRKVDFREE